MSVSRAGPDPLRRSLLLRLAPTTASTVTAGPTDVFRGIGVFHITLSKCLVAASRYRSPPHHLELGASSPPELLSSVCLPPPHSAGPCSSTSPCLRCLAVVVDQQYRSPPHHLALGAPFSPLAASAALSAASCSPAGFRRPVFSSTASAALSAAPRSPAGFRRPCVYLLPLPAALFCATPLQFL